MRILEPTLLQSTFQQLEPDAALWADLFFARLFQLDPSLRARFPNDLRHLKNELMHTLAWLIREIEHPAAWLAYIETLGLKHLEYGVQTKQYQTFGEAFFWTLEKGLGETYTPAVQHAWQHWYAQLVTVMLAAPLTVARTPETIYQHPPFAE